MPTSHETRQEIYRIAAEHLEDLQREMAEAEHEARQAAKADNRNRARKMQILLAGGVLLSSLMSALSAQAFLPPLHRPLTVEETQAIRNLCTYVASRKAVSHEWVEDIILTRFNIYKVEQLPADDYDKALTYLLTLAG